MCAQNRSQRIELDTATSQLLAGTLILYVFSVLFSRTIPLFSNLVAVALSACVLLAVVRSDRVTMTRLQFGILGILALALTWFLLATLNATDPVRHLSSTKTLVLLFSVTVASVLVMRGHERTRYVWMATACITALVGPLTVLALTVGLPFGIGPVSPRTYGLPIPPIPRALGVTLPFGFYGVLASISSSFLLSLFTWPRVFYPDRTPTRIRIVAATLLGSVVLAVFLTRSRSSLLALAAVFGLFAAACLVRVADRRGWLLVSVGVGTLAAVLARPLLVTVRGVVLSQRASFEARLEQYALAIDILAANPLLGTGAGSVITQSQFFIHNFWLLMGAWTGFPGLLLWALVFVLLFWHCIRNLRASEQHVQLWGLMMLGALVGGGIELLLFPGFNDAPAILIAVVAGSSIRRESMCKRVTG